MKETKPILPALKTGCLQEDSGAGGRDVSHQELPENILSYCPLHCGSDAETEVILPPPKETLPWAEGDEIWGLGSLQGHGHINTNVT